MFTSEENLANRLREMRPELEVWACSDSLHFGPVGGGSDLNFLAGERACDVVIRGRGSRSDYRSTATVLVSGKS